MSGRGLGACSGINAPFYDGWFGRGCRRGFGPGFGRGMEAGFGRGRGFGVRTNYAYTPAGSKEALQAQREQLQTELEAVNKRLENL